LRCSATREVQAVERSAGILRRCDPIPQTGAVDRQRRVISNP
jgi:hypothetical protein